MSRSAMARAVAALVTGVALLVGWGDGVAVAADEIGLFFDVDGEQACAEAEAFATVAAYLLILEPSASGGVSGWECALGYVNVMLSGVALEGGGLNVDTAPQFQVGIGGAPLSAGRVVKLAQLSFIVMGAGPATFSIYPYRIPSLPDSDTPVYADGANPSIIIPLSVRALDGDALAAGLNLPNCLPEEATWGRIKQVYQE